MSKECAAAIRMALKGQHPQTKFSVRTGTGTACGSTHISWTGGPAWREVQDDLDARFAAGYFESIDDSYRYTRRDPNDTAPRDRYIICNRHNEE